MRLTVPGTRAIGLFLASSLVALAVSARPLAQAAPLQIASVALNENRLTITGKNFGAAMPSVTLAGSPLTVVSNSETEIVAETPWLAPGVYVLQVSRDGGTTPEGTAKTAVTVQ